ncbi:MAG: hypothetical protein QOD09_1205 [Bradyrhizobium sp.]|jgi:hypothetical protein|nr:hypothetical protein [Bradyrhizobium sp.]
MRAEPGPAPVFLTAPALQRTASQGLRCVRNTLPGNYPPPPRIHRAETSSVHGAARECEAWIVPTP